MSEILAASPPFDRYLAVLGVHARRPSLDALSELTAAHLARVPFENVSKLYFRHDISRRGLSGLGQFLDGIERYCFGGTCYATNFHFNELLIHLGYKAALCGADMAAPNVHIVNIVTLDDRRYLVDVGYAAPLVEPIPLDDDVDREIVWGPHRYVIRPRGAGERPRLEMYRDGTLRHGYVVNPAPLRIGDFADVIAESFAEHATFMHALLITRYGAPPSVILRNLTLIAVEGAAWRFLEIPFSQLPETIERQFGMPRDIVRQALDGVQLTREP